MKLYHGSNIAVENPKILQSDRKLDFGLCFYLTSSYEQAQRLAKLTYERRNEGKKIITVYDFNEDSISDLNVKKFDRANAEWLKFVAKNRKDDYFKPDYDIVIGPVANDRTMPVIRLYFSGVYDENETLKRLLPQKLKDQYTFKTEKAIEKLKFCEVIINE